MAFPPGAGAAKQWKQGQSGNPLGRRRRLLPRIDEVLKENNLEPLRELLKLIPKLGAREQAKIWIEILPYVHAKVSETTYMPEDNSVSEMSTDELIQLATEKFSELKKAG